MSAHLAYLYAYNFYIVKKIQVDLTISTPICLHMHILSQYTISTPIGHAHYKYRSEKTATSCFTSCETVKLLNAIKWRFPIF